MFVEDAGDSLHTSRNALDSAWVLDVTTDYSNPANQPIRILAEGRDPSATLDSGFSGLTGFQNEGDNEITGFHVSNGDPSVRGLLGASDPASRSSPAGACSTPSSTGTTSPGNPPGPSCSMSYNDSTTD